MGPGGRARGGKRAGVRIKKARRRAGLSLAYSAPDGIGLFGGPLGLARFLGLVLLLILWLFPLLVLLLVRVLIVGVVHAEYSEVTRARTGSPWSTSAEDSRCSCSQIPRRPGRPGIPRSRSDRLTIV